MSLARGVTPTPPLRFQALARLQRRLDAGEVDYFYACDQFKAMRQDAQVQNVRSELTARIYECHGRAALDYGDMGEFNQCQTQLAALYAEGVPGSTAEFTAYRILYASLHRDKEGYALLRCAAGALQTPPLPGLSVRRDRKGVAASRLV